MNIECNPSINEKAQNKNAKTTVNMVKRLSLSVATDKIEAISGRLSIFIDAGRIGKFEGVHRKETKDCVGINGEEHDMDNEIEQGD